MEQNSAEIETLQRREREVGNLGSDAIDRSRKFAKELRALGQALEKFRFSAFDIELKNDIYIVTGRATMIEQVKVSWARFLCELLRGKTPQPTVTFAQSLIDLRFSLEDIEKFDVCGRVKRQDASKTPDPHSVSQILRGTGSYLDNHDVRNLVEISLRGKWVCVVYENAEGRLEEVKQDLESFYDYWVNMYLKRRNRPRMASASEPTLYVIWEELRKAHRVSTLPW